MSFWVDAISLHVLLSEDDTLEGRPLYEAIVLSARDAGLAGAKAMRGIKGYGRSGHIHETWRGFSYDLPVVVEVIDTDDKIDQWLPKLEMLREGALVTRHRVQVLRRETPEK